MFLLLSRSQNRVCNLLLTSQFSHSCCDADRACYLKVSVRVRQPILVWSHLPSWTSLYFAVSDVGGEVTDREGVQNVVDRAEGRTAGILQEIDDLKMTNVRLQPECKEAARLLKRAC